MSKPPYTRIQELFGSDRNADPFRLAILGFAKIEETLNEELDAAFDEGMPQEVRRAPFKTRVALAVALDLVPATFKDPLSRLADLRNRFAHGKIEDMSEGDGQQLFAAMRQLAPEVDKLAPSLKDEKQPEIHLANLLLIVEMGLVGFAEDARERRAHQEAVMREWWEAHALSDDQIRDLLVSDDAES